MKNLDYTKTVETLASDCSRSFAGNVTYVHHCEWEAYRYLLAALTKQAPEIFNRLSASKDPNALFEEYYRILFATKDKDYADEKSAIEQLASRMVKSLIMGNANTLSMQEIFETLLILDCVSLCSDNGRWNNQLILRYIRFTVSEYDLWKLRYYLYGGCSFNQGMIDRVGVKLMEISTDKLRTIERLHGSRGIFSGNYHEIIYSNIERRINRELSNK